LRVDIKKYLDEKAEVVNSQLEGFFPVAHGASARLTEAVRYSLFAGGKRVRPILLLAACEAVGGTEEDALYTACAFECIHTYSLIHDDLPAMDDDDLRRGKATCHKAYDEATAILAGDALLTTAFELIAVTSTDVGSVCAETVLEVITEVTRGAGTFGMIGGQMADMESEGREEVTLPEVESIHVRKTGALIVAALRSGALLGKATEDELTAITKYGEAAGFAFQIADDVLDVSGSTKELGKSVGADTKKGKATYPALIGLSESKRRATELSEMAVDALSDFGPQADPLREIARYIVERKN
jgi:geranylgeranyl diphosphate synthase type II